MSKLSFYKFLVSFILVGVSLGILSFSINSFAEQVISSTQIQQNNNNSQLILTKVVDDGFVTKITYFENRDVDIDSLLQQLNDFLK